MLPPLEPTGLNFICRECLENIQVSQQVARSERQVMLYLACARAIERIRPFFGWILTTQQNEMSPHLDSGTHRQLLVMPIDGGAAGATRAATTATAAKLGKKEKRICFVLANVRACVRACVR